MTANLTGAKQSTKVYFLLCGLAISGWAPMVPFVKDRLFLTDGNLGLLLLCLGAGAFCAMPFTGWLIKRSGCKVVMIISAAMLALGLPALALLDTWLPMAVLLAIFGAALGALDVSMNTHGATVQNLSGKHIMSSLHGLFSIGGLLGPLMIGVLLKTGLSLTTAAGLLSVGLLGLIVGWQKSLLTVAQENQEVPDVSRNNINNKQPSAWLNRTVLFLGALCFISFLSEGAMLDWSALLLHDSKGVDKALSGLGYTFFSIAMAGMRLAGDGIIAKFSRKAVVLTGSIIAFAGYSLILLAPWLPVTLFGFVLIGTGCANIVPVFFSTVGSMKGVPSASAVAVMGTIGYTGQLVGPAGLGFLAQHLSLPVALFITGVLILIAGLAYHMSHLRLNRQG